MNLLNFFHDTCAVCWDLIKRAEIFIFFPLSLYVLKLLYNFKGLYIHRIFLKDTINLRSEQTWEELEEGKERVNSWIIF